MTITYTKEVGTCHFGCFVRLLKRWRGSIYKLIWMDLLVFLCEYYALNLIYRFLLNEGQKKIFEDVVLYCSFNEALIPLSFVLGFYVKIVMERWWSQYMTIPWPDPIGVYVSSLLQGQDERGRLMRRTVMRYVCLCLTMVFAMISPAVKKRFPTLDHFVDAGLLLENEKEIISAMDETFPRHQKHWMPILWASSIITRARKEGRIRDDSSLQTLINELNKFHGMCARLIHYDTISIPLVYTQVVSLAVYAYFLSAAVGQQWIERPDRYGFTNVAVFYFPFFTMLEFFFYMGWLKVAETLICPFGDDDDDFEVNEMIDRNLQVSYLIADEMHHEHPELFKDQYWNEVFLRDYRNRTSMNEAPSEQSTGKSKLDIEDSNVESDVRKELASDFLLYLSQLNLALETLIRRDEAGISVEKMVNASTTSAPDDKSAPKKDNKSENINNSQEELDVDKDDFELLKEERERERSERNKQKFNQTADNAAQAFDRNLSSATMIVTASASRTSQTLLLQSEEASSIEHAVRSRSSSADSQQRTADQGSKQ